MPAVLKFWELPLLGASVASLGQYRDSFFTVITKRSLLTFSYFHFELTFHKRMLEGRRRRGRRRKQRQPPGPLRASPGLYRDSCTLPFLTLTLVGVGQLHVPPALTLGQITQCPLSQSSLSYALTQYLCELTSLNVSTRSYLSPHLLFCCYLCCSMYCLCVNVYCTTATG